MISFFPMGISCFGKPTITKFFLSVFFIAILSFSTYAQVQDICQELPCSATVVEIIPEYENVSCQTSPTCSASDPARQMQYKVYLNYNIPNPPNNLPFNLDYASIDVIIDLKMVNPTTGGYSKFNEKSSKTCSGEQFNQWDSETLVATSATQMSFSLSDDIVGNCPPDQVVFEPLQGGGWRAYLFTIVIDAYPGETFYLECNSVAIHSDNSDCAYPGGSNPNQNLLTPLPTPQVTVNMPVTPVSNAHLLVYTPTPAASGNGATFNIMLKSTTGFTANTVIDYVEFSADLILSTSMSGPIVVTTFNGIGAAQEIIDGNTIHYIFRTDINASSFPLTSGDGVLLATIELPGPSLTNSCWNAKIMFPQDNKGRVKSNFECSGLNLAANTQFYEVTNCPNPCDKIGFQMVTVPDPNSCGFYLNLGLVNLGLPSSTIEIQEFDIQFYYEKSEQLTIFPPSLNAFASSSLYGFDQESFTYLASWPPPKKINFIDQDYISFYLSGDGCLSDAVLTKLSITHGPASDPIKCMPQILPPVNIPACDTKQLKGEILTFSSEDNSLIQTSPVYFHPAAHEGVEEVTVEVVPKLTQTCNPFSCIEDQFTDVDGQFSFCLDCQECQTGSYTITPTLELDPLNGVNTFDLILISRHILGLEPFNSPFKMIGADANKTGTITTFDVVELRKLILGTYVNLPANSSWRFFDEGITFANPENPFAENIGAKEIITTMIPDPNINFIGVKIGDVDWTAIPNQRPGELPSVSIRCSVPEKKKGVEYLTIPVYYTGNTALEGIQLSLQFNPDVLQFISPLQGEVQGFSADNFGLSKVSDGCINVLWHYNPAEPDMLIQEGDVLFYLTFKIKQDFSEGTNLISLNTSDTGISNFSWGASDEQYQIVSTAMTETQLRDHTQVNSSTEVSVSPNPTSGDFVLTVTGYAPQEATFGIFGPYGQVIMTRNLKLTGKKQEFNFSEMHHLPAGAYIWKLWKPDSNISGVIIKD